MAKFYELYSKVHQKKFKFSLKIRRLDSIRSLHGISLSNENFLGCHYLGKQIFTHDCEKRYCVPNRDCEVKSRLC